MAQVIYLTFRSVTVIGVFVFFNIRITVSKKIGNIYFKRLGNIVQPGGIGVGLASFNFGIGAMGDPDLVGHVLLREPL